MTKYLLGLITGLALTTTFAYASILKATSSVPVLPDNYSPTIAELTTTQLKEQLNETNLLLSKYAMLYDKCKPN